ncbi:MAG: response regulator, partial [Nanoarchaeota archaeon]|nr:response regulator [Nanoarchaeota archaeon]
ENGEKALEFLASKQYDLMITDIGMPHMSGWQLAKQIKGKYESMKVAVVTGWGNNVPSEQKRENGVGYVLGKPIQMERLKGLIGEVLQMKTKENVEYNPV